MPCRDSRRWEYATRRSTLVHAGPSITFGNARGIWAKFVRRHKTWIEPWRDMFAVRPRAHRRAGTRRALAQTTATPRRPSRSLTAGHSDTARCAITACMRSFYTQSQFPERYA
ncbi:hypothetical protein [Lysobacter gummosus]|uniref:hypothetical protein n=1 Tax=Lysobacter gummosus TaxID=262324 RepID=UPI00363CFBB6